MSFGKRFSIMVLTLPKKLLLKSGFHTILKGNAYDTPTPTPTQKLKNRFLTHEVVFGIILNVISNPSKLTHFPYKFIGSEIPGI